MTKQTEKREVSEGRQVRSNARRALAITETRNRYELGVLGREILKPWGCWLVDEGGLGGRSAAAYISLIWSALVHHDGNLRAAVTREGIMPSSRNALRAAIVRWAQYTDDPDLAMFVQSPAVSKLSRARASPHLSIVRGPLPDETVDLILALVSADRGKAKRPRWSWACLRLLIKLGLRGRVDLVEMARASIVQAVKSNILVIASKGDRERRLPAKHVRHELEDIVSWPAGWKTLAEFMVPKGRSTNQSTAAYDLLRAELKHYGALVGLDAEEVYPHRFRHTAAMRLYRATKDIVAVQKFLGHRNIETTRRYLGGEQLAELDSALDDLYPKE